MSEKFDRALAILLEREGGYVNDPKDPGGETIYGITRRDHPDAWAVGRPTLEQAAEIYRTKYWAPVKGDDLPWPLCLYVFDAAVNQGVGPATRMLQRALDTVQDELIGGATLRLAAQSRPWHWARFLAFRAMRYTGTRNFDRFGEGWFIRLFELVESAR